MSLFNERIKQWLDRVIVVEADGRLADPKKLPLNEEAQLAWEAFHDRIEGSLAEEGEFFEIRDLVGKMPDHAARLAAIFYAFNGGEGPVCGRCMAAGNKLGIFYAREMKRVVAELIQPVELNNASVLSRWLIRECRKTGTRLVSRRRLRQYGPGSLRRVEACDEALNILSETGHVRFGRVGGGSQIEVNPYLIPQIQPPARSSSS